MQLLFNTIMLEINRWTEHHNITIPLINLLEMLKSKDFNELEIWQYHLSSLSEDEVVMLAKKMNELNMTAPVVGAYARLHLNGLEADNMNNMLDHLISSSVLLGSKVFKIIPGSLASNRVDLPTWKLSVARLKELSIKLAEKGIALSMETHANSLCDNEDSSVRLLNDLSGFDNVGICYQPFDSQNTEQAMETFSNLLPHIIHVHLQNLPDENSETTTFLETGGWMDYEKLLPHIKRSGFDQILCLEFTEGIFPPEGEDFNPKTVINNAAKDRAFFYKLWK